ncbi:MAG: hypothetical protein ACI3Y2_02345 [Candidatus Egerieousia sp.]
MGSIIEVEKSDITRQKQAFGEFMKKTEDLLNERTINDRTLYKSDSGFKFEKIALATLKEIAPYTPFPAESIKLVSGHTFPDIIAGKCFGVEVKTTTSDSWKSTGSSILESTRNLNVTDIYMLFGKLGGERAEFRCRPYESCLSDIAVTHFPRYMIDMNLNSEGKQTILEKINIPYNEFRLLSEVEKTEAVRLYYRRKTKLSGIKEMPWWMGPDNISKPTLSFFSDLPVTEKNDLKVRMLILFIKDILKSDYSNVALWLCTRYSLLNMSLRDLFSAGGSVKSIGPYEFSESVPRIVANIYKYRFEIAEKLRKPDSTLVTDFQDILGTSNYGMEEWLSTIALCLKSKKETSDVDIYKLLEDII